MAFTVKKNHFMRCALNKQVEASNVIGMGHKQTFLLMHKIISLSARAICISTLSIIPTLLKSFYRHKIQFLFVSLT